MENQVKTSFWKTNLGIILKYFGWEIPLFLLIWWLSNINSHVSTAQLNQTGQWAPGVNWTPASTWTCIGFIIIIAGIAIWRGWDEVKSIFKRK